MGQHFLLSAKARTLSVIDVARMSDAGAYAAFKAVRFAENGGEAFCPKCGSVAVYEFASRPIFKCQVCDHQFSLTSGTIFANRKLAYRDMLTAIALFVNGANGYPALRLSRDLRVSYKAAWVLLHKLRVVMGAIQHEVILTGEVEMDGVFVGGYMREKNLKVDREKDAAERRKKRREGKVDMFGTPDNKDPAKRACIVTLRERRRGGRSRSFALPAEHLVIPHIPHAVDPKVMFLTDAAAHWFQLELNYDRREVPHSIGHVVNGIHINGVEASHTRIRRAERGVYMRVVGPHLQSYADEMSWRDDHRRVANGQQYQGVLRRVATQPVSPAWVGRWQKRPEVSAQAA